MRLAVISDIHGNLDAFDRVLCDIDGSNIDAAVCLGDNVGYGPEPEQVVALIQNRNIPSVMGNHELALSDKQYLNWFNPFARASLTKTVEMLSENSFKFIRGLKPCISKFDCLFVHGLPPDSPTTYLFEASVERLQHIFENMKEKFCFVGHTHTLQTIGYDGQTVFHSPLRRGVTNLNPANHYIINVGSVGQPRDGNNNAKYVIWNASENSIEVKFIPYNIESVVSKITKAGLPEVHASRLR